MGQMPMGGPQMGGAAPMPRPMRRGTSKAVPIVVSAGLAVGVFCGLLFGVGTGKPTTAEAAPSGNNAKKAEDHKAAPAGVGATSTVGSTTPKTATPPPAGSGAGSGSATVAVTTPPPATVKEEKKIKLTVKVKPEAAASIAKISVDGAEIQGMATDLPGDQKTVKVVVKASGFRTAEKKLDLVGDEMTFEIELSKRASSSGGVRPPKRPDRPPSNSGGGLIDI